jgi:hypothetical protein
MKTLSEGILFCYINNVSGRTGLCGDATRAPGRQEGFVRHLLRRDPEDGFTAFLQKRKVPGGPGGRSPPPEKHGIGMDPVSYMQMKVVPEVLHSS